MGSRSGEEVRADLIAAGVNTSLADIYKEAAGKTGREARKWTNSHSSLEILEPDQEKKLFKSEYKRTTDKVASFLSDPQKDYVKNGASWRLAVNLEKLNPAILAFLVDLAYRGDLRKESWSYIKDAVIRNDLRSLRNLVSDKTAHKKHFFDNYLRYKSRSEILGAPAMTLEKWNAR